MNGSDHDSFGVPSDAKAGVVIEAESLRVTYPRARSTSIADVSVHLTDGVNALVGRNGAGKSTFMNAIVTLQKVHTGRLRVLGVEFPASEKARRGLMTQIGYLPQQFGYLPGFTVREFIEYAAWLKRIPSSTRAHAVEVAIATADLTDRAGTKLSKLSGGMLRRAGIATAIVHNPRLLVLDEPTSGLDPEQRIRFREMLRKVSEGRCVLISSHLIEDVQAVADRVLVLDTGKLVFSGTVAEMQAHASAGAAGDSALERAYTTLLARSSKDGESA